MRALKKHWGNLCYLAKHKWYVYKAGRALGVGRRQLFIHDWSKLLPIEWFAYADYFFGQGVETFHEAGKRTDPVAVAFDRAWAHHLRKNPHHWQCWVSGETAVSMPMKYIREMVADWAGAGAAQGKTDRMHVHRWYTENRSRMTLHPVTQDSVEMLIEEYTGTGFEGLFSCRL